MTNATPLNGLEHRRRRFVAAAEGDFRHSGVKAHYHQEHRSYSVALGQALGLPRSRATGYYTDDTGVPLSIKRMEEMALAQGLLSETSY